jgi:hypothetical protein
MKTTVWIVEYRYKKRRSYNPWIILQSGLRTSRASAAALAKECENCCTHLEYRPAKYMRAE